MPSPQDHSPPRLPPPFGMHPLDNLVPSPASDKENLPPITTGREARETMSYDPGAAQMPALSETQDQHNTGINQTHGVDPMQVRDAATPAIGLVTDDAQLAFSMQYQSAPTRTPSAATDGNDRQMYVTPGPSLAVQRLPPMSNFLFGAMSTDLSSATINVR